MGWPTLAATYFITWWIVLFAVLPFGVRSQDESGEVVPGSDPGAPTLTGLKSKVVWTTVVTTILCGVFYAAYVNHLISLDAMAAWLGVAR